MTTTEAKADTVGTEEHHQLKLATCRLGELLAHNGCDATHPIVAVATAAMHVRAHALRAVIETVDPDCSAEMLIGWAEEDAGEIASNHKDWDCSVCRTAMAFDAIATTHPAYTA